MSHTSPRVLIITGLMASGKSRVAQAIAERLPRSVHLRGDVFRKMIVSGRAEVSPGPSREALDQLKLRYQLACDACISYAEAGFSVVYQDVILSEHLAEVVARLGRYSPGVVVLNPPPDVVAQRDAGRSKTAYAGTWTPAALAEVLNRTPAIGLWIDTSSMSVAETADYILGRADLTRQKNAAARVL